MEIHNTYEVNNTIDDIKEARNILKDRTKAYNKTKVYDVHITSHDDFRHVRVRAFDRADAIDAAWTIIWDDRFEETECDKCKVVAKLYKPRQTQTKHRSKK